MGESTTNVWDGPRVFDEARFELLRLRPTAGGGPPERPIEVAGGSPDGCYLALWDADAGIWVCRPSPLAGWAAAARAGADRANLAAPPAPPTEPPPAATDDEGADW